ncbi:hypothetical protein MCHI_002786 [Candidatus Magnetoovum chiemensis]|nr:hypothetical protein MCHI_002786 [Candidatus Magnetoovum chiemensis]
MPKSKGNISAQFATSCVIESAGSYRLELNSEDNGSKSAFTPVVDESFIRLYPGGTSPSLWANVGTVSMRSSDQRADYTEYLTIANSNSASLAYLPVGRVQTSWQGAHLGGSVGITFDGQTVNFSSAVSGILKCTYQYSYDLLKATCRDVTEMFIVASKTALGLYGDITVDFTAEAETVETILTVYHGCSKNVIANASVYVGVSPSEQTYRGKTNANGQLKLGMMSKGRYSVKATAAGYQSTDADTIANDWFTVS